MLRSKQGLHSHAKKCEKFDKHQRRKESKYWNTQHGVVPVLVFQRQTLKSDLSAQNPLFSEISCLAKILHLHTSRVCKSWILNAKIVFQCLPFKTPKWKHIVLCVSLFAVFLTLVFAQCHLFEYGNGVFAASKAFEGTVLMWQRHNIKISMCTIPRPKYE